MTAWSYADLKKWRGKNKRTGDYNRLYMKRKRREYKAQLKAGLIAYEDIPKSFRPSKKLI